METITNLTSKNINRRSTSKILNQEIKVIINTTCKTELNEIKNLKVAINYTKNRNTKNCKIYKKRFKNLIEAFEIKGWELTENFLKINEKREQLVSQLTKYVDELNKFYLRQNIPKIHLEILI